MDPNQPDLSHVSSSLFYNTERSVVGAAVNLLLFPLNSWVTVKNPFGPQKTYVNI